MSESPSSSSSGRKEIPKRLEDELKAIPKFKPRVEPTRRTVADILGESVERAAYDEILGPLINRGRSSSSLPAAAVRNNNPSYNIPSRNESRNENDSDFTTTLLTRLADAEAETKSMRRQLVEKMGKVNSLESENAQLLALVEIPSHLVEEINFYKAENDRLEAQIVDMNDFLRDYGLEWVGHSSSGSNTGSKEEFENQGVNYHVFARKVEELNSQLSSEPAQIKSDSRRARLVHASELFDSVAITFYCDGIMIRRGPFKENKSESYISFVRDIIGKLMS
jgi:predicted RNA-binding protein with RPS1 domain